MKNFSILMLLAAFASAGNVFAASKTSSAKPSTTQIKSGATSSEAEDWKGTPDFPDYDVGVLGGFGILDNTGGFSLLGTVSRKLVNQGFVPDLNDSVAIELEIGPFFTSGGTSLFYSTHLRWNFRKNEAWTLYALGGFAGYGVSSDLGNRFEFFPRFGIGAMYKMDGIYLRGEASHELIALGLSFPL